jgi:hypothetical protein
MALEYVCRGVRASGGLVPDADGVSAMTTAIIGTGGIGSAIAGRLASGGETLRLSSADRSSQPCFRLRMGTRSLSASLLERAESATAALRPQALAVVDLERARRLVPEGVPTVVPRSRLLAQQS